MKQAMIVGLAVLLLLGSEVRSKVYLHETFDDSSWEDRWVQSNWKESDGSSGKFTLDAGKYHNDESADMSLKTSEDSKFYTATRVFEGFSTKDKTFVLQFQVKNEQSIECGGAYLKIGPKVEDQNEFTGETKYSIMFGPDVCGSMKKTHVILNYKEKNLDRKKEVEMKSDHLSHLYTLIVRPNNTYEVKIDQSKVASGSLYDDWDFLLPKKIKDPAMKKPKDWVDVKEIDDADDKKPADWVEEKQVVDAAATKPEEWDEEEDGEWVAPMIDNPEYKGEWKSKKIPNPEYKGAWEHPMVENPDFVDDKSVYLFEDMSMVGIDLWQVKAGTMFDNIVVTDSEEDAKKIADETFVPLAKAEKEQKDIEDSKKAEEAKRKEEEDKEKKSTPAEDEDEEEEEDEKPEHDEL